MNDLRRVSWIAITLIVLLRLSIGWQFLYEGMWKYDTMDTPSPWSAEGYLKNAQGPARDYFRAMTGDPDDLKWLDYAEMSAKWNDWRNRFVAHYSLDEEQRKQLNRLVDGSASAVTDPTIVPDSPPTLQPLPALPKGVTVDDKKLEGIVEYDAAKKQLVAFLPLMPSEEALLLGKVDVVRTDAGYETAEGKPAPADQVTYYKAVERMATISRRLSYKQRLAALLKGDPDRVGVTGRLNERGSFDIVMGTTSAREEDKETTSIRYGKMQEYRDLVRDYNAAVEQAKIDYQVDHAQKLGLKLAQLRSEVVGPVRALEADLRADALDLLTREQFRVGSLPPANTSLHRANQQAMWGLLILGTLLLTGLFTRFAAVLGAFMVFNFYMVMPPWPGVPPAPGPEHSFIINKNLIECIALLGIAALPTGSWFGLDGLFNALWKRRGSKPVNDAKTA